MRRLPPLYTLFPYTTLFRSVFGNISHDMFGDLTTISFGFKKGENDVFRNVKIDGVKVNDPTFAETMESKSYNRSEEHTSELQSRRDLVCRLLLEQKKRRHTA